MVLSPVNWAFGGNLSDLMMAVVSTQKEIILRGITEGMIPWVERGDDYGSFLRFWTKREWGL